MPKRKRPTHRHRNIFKAQHHFTDRDEPREMFATALATPQGDEEYRLLNYYGFGGLGKTALCEQFTLSLAEQKEQPQNKGLGWAKIDFELSLNRNPAEALLAIRLQLAERCRIPFPAFDTAFARYFAFSRQGHDINDAYPALSKESEMLQGLEGVVGDVAEEIPGAGLILKYLKKLGRKTQDWWQKRGKDILEDLDTLEQHKLLQALPTYLGADIDDWLFGEKAITAQQQGKPRRLVILFDTYEALWRDQTLKTGMEAMRVDAWICNLVEETPAVLYVMLGRDQLKWGQDWQDYIEAHLLGGLSPTDAEQFLNAVPIVEPDIRTTIINSSAGIPFYLDLQVDYYESLKQQQSTLDASLFGGKEADILPRFIDHLDEQSCHTLKVISHARFIDPKLIQIIAAEFFGGKASIDFNKLTHYSFWQQHNKTWSLHGLMRDYLQDHQRQQQADLFKQVHQFLFEYYDQQLDTLEQVIDITPSHQSALQEAAYHLQQVDVTQFPKWANRRGQIFYDAYAWDVIEPLWQQAQEIAESQSSDKLFDTAHMLGNLASLYQSQGKYTKAESLSQQSLRIKEKIPEGKHFCVANTLAQLAGLHHSQGNYTKAENLYLQSLKILERPLRVNHLNVRSLKAIDKLLRDDPPIIASILNNLAGVYHSQGKYIEAESLYKRSLKINEKTLEKDHLMIANTLHNLACLYSSQGKYKKAEFLCLQSLKTTEKSLGKDHPSVAITLNNLAKVYQSKGKYKKAESLYQQGLSIFENVLGKNHLEVANTLNNLANLYRNQGSYEKVESLYQRSLKIRERSLGANHPKTATVLNNLAAFYEYQVKYAKAESLYQRSLKISEKSFGENHSAVAVVLHNLAFLYKSLGEYTKAEPLFLRSLNINEKSFGENHPSVATTLQSLAELYRVQDKSKEAESFFLRSLRIFEKLFDKNHPSTANVLNSLANSYRSQKEYEKAKPLYQRSLKIKEKLLSKYHPERAIVLNNLASLYKSQKKYAKAETLSLQSLEIHEKFPLETPAMAATLNTLAKLYDIQNEYVKAKPFYQRAINILEKAFPNGHPNLTKVKSNYAKMKKQQSQPSKNN